MAWVRSGGGNLVSREPDITFSYYNHPNVFESKQLIIMKKLLLLTFGLLLPMLVIGPPQSSASESEILTVKIRHPHRSLEKEKIDLTKEYKYQLLDLILSKTEESDGPYRIESLPTAGQSRMVELIDSGIYTAYITMTSKAREEMLLPIRIPVYKGMYGYRVFLIRKGDQERFDAIKSEAELKQVWAGQGRDWPDFDILTHNGYKVIGSLSWLTLYGMLTEKRFDYFPRGIHEPWKEIVANPDKELEVEKRFMLHYPAPGYIFVSKDNKKLAERLERGFRLAIEDGSFDRLFYNHPDVSHVLEQANVKERTIFELENPLLSPQTPLADKSLWLSFEQ